ncbi:hypothetical protein [Siphonobacter sp. BAB-5405]|uniref:hypothetical protein n=1 Tax=Siphonobacter sp. BAB-5405 TaxID=1864825 RepID=UPI0011AEF5CB|nr:hypothetical protein [Siphonobacter sp. BAB-5405]
MKKLPYISGLCSLMIIFCIGASCKKPDDNFKEPVEQRTDTLTVAQLRDFSSLPLPTEFILQMLGNKAIIIWIRGIEKRLTTWA